ncbi:uncharacterized protein ARMOST_13647 [Armillaria ostoyae]|uniref:Mug135-like C-terminal domain-containing protein n=1 Tax=Armillaria ostoyae TaxID=47428 RepID=A0A284RNB1_ARMOS|nr:uncharacterized protein ARMOST_13647 [Armillaria ostoyae]
MSQAPQPVPLRLITPPVLPPTAASFIARLEMPDPIPSLKNITNSDNYVATIKNHLYGSEKPTLGEEDLGKAIVNQHRLLTAHTADHAEQMPPWARMMEQRLQATANSNKEELRRSIAGVRSDLTQAKKDLQAKIKEVRTELTQAKEELQAQITEVDEKVQALSSRIINIEILTGRAHNLSCGDGNDRAYVIISSPTGCLPHHETFCHGNQQLPPLHCADDFRNLDDMQLDAYLQRYAIQCNRRQLTRHEEKLSMLRYYVGCKASL